MRLSPRLLISFVLFLAASFAASQSVEYKVLATNKTSTSQKEMNEASDAGFQFGGVMGGETVLADRK